MARSDTVVPVFVLDPCLLSSPYVGPQRTAFLFAGLRSLDQGLHRLGSRLIIRCGEPVKELATLAFESNATAIFAEEDISPYARQRDTQVQDALPLILTGGLTVHPPELVFKKNGQPYTVFTPYSKAWKALPRPGATDLLPRPVALNTPVDLITLPIPAEPVLSNQGRFKPGENEALKRLEKFTARGDQAIYNYAERRNRPDVDSTSGLSPYIRFGMLSLRRWWLPPARRSTLPMISRAAKVRKHG